MIVARKLFWGSPLRGIYGHYLKQQFCVAPVSGCENHCQHPATCPYPTAFEPVPTPELRRKGRQHPPPPFVIEPPPETGPHTATYPAHSLLRFHFVSFGKNAHEVTAVHKLRTWVTAVGNFKALRRFGEAGWRLV